MSDLSVALAEGKLNIRVAAWCEVEGKLLVCHYQDQTITLPGGRVKFGESTVEALTREIKEELDTTCVSIDYLGVIENLFEQKVAYHELLFVYVVELAEKNRFKQTQTEEFAWIPLIKIQDQLVPQALVNLKKTPKTHMINKESSF